MITTQAAPNAITIALTAPMTTPIPALATAAQTLRSGPTRRSSGTVASAMPIGTRGRRNFGSTRGVLGTGLAFFRHPASTSAAMARAAIHPACVVRSVTDTTTDSVLIAPRPRWWAWLIAGVSLLFLVAIAVAALIPSEWVAEAENPRLDEMQPAPYARIPASAESVNDRIVYTGLPDEVEVFDTNGDFFFVTVSAPTQSMLSWLVGAGDPVELLTEEGRNGRRTATQNREISLQQMRTATQEAQYVALTVAGYDPTIENGEVVVQDVLCRVPGEDRLECAEPFPADEALDPADAILAVDGVPVGTIDDLAAELDGRSPGDVIELRIRRPTVGELDVEVELSSDPDDPDRTIVGFVPFDTRSITLPFDVAIDSGAVGGPSAGLAFTLALIDELTEGDLTGGRNIAVTGTIDLEGNVGPIGGLRQKMSAVQQHGVDVFIVPANQIEFSDDDPSTDLDDDICRLECLNEAADDEVVIIKVATLEEALIALQTLGGDPPIPVGGGDDTTAS